MRRMVVIYNNMVVDDAFQKMCDSLAVYLNGTQENEKDVVVAVPVNVVIQVIDFDKSTSELCRAVTISSNGVRVQSIPAEDLMKDNSEW
jgi:Tfp pilus assembly PilM family ATPase